MSAANKSNTAWVWQQQRGTAEELHAWQPPPEDIPTVRHLEVTSAAIVLGSSQPDADIDRDVAAAHSIEVVRRRSGGGAVLLVPGEHLWLDLYLPRVHEWWDDDVIASSAWLGAVWASAFARLDVADLVVHEGPMAETAWSSAVCFAGMGPGEVASRGCKLLGLSQRRTRDWARFQCVVHHVWQPALVTELIAPTKRPAGTDLPDVATVGPLGVLEAFSEEISAP